MEVQGHFHDGAIIPKDGLVLPNGTEVTITIHSECSNPQMSDEERNRYLAALTRLDATPNENPDDSFSGVNHDRELYGTGS